MRAVCMFVLATLLVGVAPVVSAEEAAAELPPDWLSKVRPDHPRLFFNADTWPQVKAYALGPERAASVRRPADQLASGCRSSSGRKPW